MSDKTDTAIQELSIAGTAVMQAAKHHEQSIMTVYATMETMQQRDPQLTHKLREQYSLLQQLGAIANTSDELFRAMESLFQVLERQKIGASLTGSLVSVVAKN